jgi:hypothetical protein
MAATEIAIDVAPGTYDVSLQFKNGGTTSVRERKLWAAGRLQP